MLVRFRCEDCGQKYQVENNYADAEFRCVACGGKLVIPENSTIKDRPAVDLGENDSRPLMHIPVMTKHTETGSSESPDEKTAPEPPPPIKAKQAPAPPKLRPAGKLDRTPQPRKVNVRPPKKVAQLADKSVAPTAKAAKIPDHNKGHKKIAAAQLGTGLNISPADNLSPAADKPALKPKTMPAKQAPAGDNKGGKGLSLPKVEKQDDWFCPRHPKRRTTSFCNNCNTPICLECRQAWGYYCSPECRDAALNAADRTLKQKNQDEFRKLAWIGKTLKISFLLLMAAVMIFIGLWVWKQFLDPGGKLAWQKKIEFNGGFSFFDIKPQQFTVYDDNGLLTIATKDGKIVRKVQKPLFKQYSSFSKKIGNKMILHAKKTMVAVNTSGQELWHCTFTYPISQVACGTTAAIVTTVQEIPPDMTKIRRTRFGYVSPPPTYKYYLHAVSLDDGSKLWNKPLGAHSLGMLQALDDRYMFLTGGDDGSLYLVVNDMAENEELWRAKMKSSSLPYIYKKLLIFKPGFTCGAIDFNGKKIWTCQVAGGLLNAPEKCDDLGFFSDGSNFSVVNFKTGSLLWTKPLKIFRVSYVAGRILYRISEEDKEYTKMHQNDQPARLPKAYEELQKGDKTMQAMLSGFKKKKKRNIRLADYIICLDAHNGKRLWKSPKVLGSLVVGNQRAVIFRDSALTTMVSVINSNVGESVVEQLDLQTGEKMFSRSDHIGFMSPMRIIGNKLVGTTFDRHAGRQYSTGLAAFNLK